MQIVLTVFVFLLLSWGTARAAQPTCTLAWDAPTTRSDGAPFPGHIIDYRIYHYAPNHRQGG